MPLVVADAGPLHYLVLTGDIELLPKLFERVLVPQVVRDELANAEAPQAVRDWIARAPGWLEVRRAPGADDVAVAKLDEGERAAIALALAVKAELVLMDDREGVGIARGRGLAVIGTPGVLDLAARRGLIDLELRPVFHWTAPRVRAHLLLCMLAYYLQWHMRRSFAPMLFDEPDPAAREAQPTSPVAKAEPSPAAQRKAARKRTEPVDGEPLPVHSFHTLLGDLATLTRNVVRLGRDRLTAILATPTPTPHRALDLLGVTLAA